MTSERILPKWTLTSAPGPEIHLRLTEIPLMARGGARFTGTIYPTRISLTDCAISSESLFSTPPTGDLILALTNSAFARMDLNLGFPQRQHDDSLRPQQPVQFLQPDFESANREQMGVAG